ncbi:hypothetical protein ACIP5Y_31525 [Nocardia sp. NPDC088792]|uniref:hypothetical protein n=1 Tax=Nocardia sp. NPDC088792 TaxID=3364332 RepID=UPI0037F70D58
MTYTNPPAQHCTKFGRLAITGSAVAVAGAAIMAGGLVADPAEAVAAPGGSCQWAGASHPEGDTVYAGGSAFTCTAARWSQAPAPGHPSTVPSPGATQAAATGFSVGAVQPGTAYFDTCIADTVQPGTTYVFQAVDFNGNVLWRADGVSSQWTFDPSTPAQPADTNTCVDGVLN